MRAAVGSSTLVFAMLVVSGCSQPADQGPAGAIAAVRGLFIAIAESDEDTIRGLIKPNPDAAILWQGKAKPEEVEKMKELLEGEAFRLVQTGEKLNLPGGKVLNLTEGMITDDRQLVMPTIGREDRRIPLWVERQDGKWIVDAGPLIVIRVTAKKFMDARKEK